KSGMKHISDGLRQASAAGGINQLHWIFSEIKPEEVDHFEFQTRLYEWTEFKDLPVEPGKKLAAVQLQEPEPRELSLLSKKQSEWIKKLNSLTEHNQTAFAVGPSMIFELPPDEAWEVVQAV